MYTKKQLQNIFEQYLLANRFQKTPNALYEPINYILSSGGKRLRSTLLLMSCNLFSKSVTEALPAAYAVELFHNFSLLHDDIMDEAPLRRGRPTVHEKYNVNTAILSGDVMLVYVYDYLSRLEENIQVMVFKEFNRVGIKVCEGQQMDMDFETSDDVEIEDYLTMIEFKTAVLLVGAMKIGAIIGNASKNDVEHIGAFAKHLGIAFQLQDDILDTFGNPKTFGKQVGGDIIQNKKTFLLLKTMELANEKQHARLIDLMTQKDIVATDKVEAVKQLYQDLNIKALAEAKRDLYYETAIEHLDAMNICEEKHQVLLNFAANLMQREV